MQLSDAISNDGEELVADEASEPLPPLDADADDELEKQANDAIFGNEREELELPEHADDDVVAEIDLSETIGETIGEDDAESVLDEDDDRLIDGHDDGGIPSTNREPSCLDDDADGNIGDGDELGADGRRRSVVRWRMAAHINDPEPEIEPTSVGIVCCPRGFTYRHEWFDGTLKCELEFTFACEISTSSWVKPKPPRRQRCKPF